MDCLRKGMEIYLKDAQDFPKQMAEAMRVHQNLQLNISETIAGVNVAFKHFQETTSILQNQFIDQECFDRTRELVISAGQGLRQYFRELPQWTQEAVLLMAERGWFFDLALTLPALGKIAERLSSGHEEEVEEVLVAYFEQETEFYRELLG